MYRVAIICSFSISAKNICHVLQEEIEKSEAGGTGYEKMGTVYRDPETGQLYMLEEGASGQ